MNNKDNAINEITKFIEGEEKILLLTGTHQYIKHKLTMSLLNKYYNNAKILFRTNGMDNLSNKDFVGFAGVKNNPKSGEKIKIGKNYYFFDSLNKRTWSRTGNNHDIAILYPVDSALRGNVEEVIENIISKVKEKGKIFIISWTDSPTLDFDKVEHYCDINVIYDAKEEDENYHNRVEKILNR